MISWLISVARSFHCQACLRALSHHRRRRRRRLGSVAPNPRFVKKKELFSRATGTSRQHIKIDWRGGVWAIDDLHADGDKTGQTATVCATSEREHIQAPRFVSCPLPNPRSSLPLACIACRSCAQSVQRLQLGDTIITVIVSIMAFFLFVVVARRLEEQWQSTSETFATISLPGALPRISIFG